MAKRTYNRRGRQTAKTPVRSDKGRAQRIKGAQTARNTGSRDRMTIGRGVTRTRTGAPRGAQGPANPPQQGPSRAVPRTMGGDTGRRIPQNKYGTKGTPKSGPPMQRTPKTPGRFADNPQVQANVERLRGQLGMLAGLMKGGAQGLGMAILNAGPTAPGTMDEALRRGTYRPMQGPADPDAGMTRAQSFDKAFARARAAGKKVFTWDGKKYNTKLKGE